MAKFSQSDIDRALSKVMHPEIKYSLVDLGMIEDVVCEEGKVRLTLKLPFLNVPVKESLIQGIKEALAALDEAIQVKLNLEQMNKEERDNFTKMAKEGWKL